MNGDSKTIKGLKKGFLTAILYLAPSNTSGLIDVCSCSSDGCEWSCLFTSGRAGFDPNINLARIAKTRLMVTNPLPFYLSIAHDLTTLERRAKREHKLPCARLNGTSDLPELGQFFAHLFPEVQFYDYTKIPRPWVRQLPNYHLSFSHSETNLQHCFDALNHGISVAVVFGSKKGTPLPATWHGFPVINGDDSDLRFKDPRGVVVGLYAKGRAKQDISGFVVRESANLVNIALVPRKAA